MLDEDRLVWIDSSYGHYSVKSGYKLMMNATGMDVNESQQDDWQSLWKIIAPPKTKHLLWRISKGCLPTRLRLREKHVPCPMSCMICTCEEEDEWHVMFGCATQNQVWQAAGLDDIIMPRIQQGSNARSVIFEVCSGTNLMKAGLFATVIWVIWNNRNNKVWNDVAESGRSLGCKAKQMWEEWFLIHNLQPSQQHNTQQLQHGSWQKPSNGWLKCNVDAGFHKELNKTSTGWCLRDHMGRFIRAETTWIDGKCSIVEGESMALIEALHKRHHSCHY